MANKKINTILSVIRSCKLDNDLSELLKGLLTPQEIDAIAMRIAIIKRLKKGNSQRAIANDLGVGIATITRGAKELKKGYFKNLN